MLRLIFIDKFNLAHILNRKEEEEEEEERSNNDKNPRCRYYNWLG